MTLSVDLGMIAGDYVHWASKRDSNGYGKGILANPDVPVNNTVYGAHYMPDPISFTPGAPTYETATERAGQSLGVQRDMGPTSWGNPALSRSRYDERFDGLIKGYTPDTTTLTNAVITASNVKRKRPVPLIMGFCLGYTSDLYGEQFMTYIMNNTTVQPGEVGSGQSGGTNQNPNNLTLVPSPSVRSGAGLLYSATALAVAGNSDLLMKIRGAYPYYHTVYVADGTATTFTLPFLPVSSDATGGATNLISKNGVKTAVTSISTTTGLVTLAAAGSAGDIWTLLYQTNWDIP